MRAQNVHLLKYPGLRRQHLGLSKMADKKRTWSAFKNQMKAKKLKILAAQRYKNRKTQNFGQSAKLYEGREFVTYQDGELTIEGIKDACERHFAMEELSCLASDQGPSSTLVEHIPDLRVFHVRFVNETSKLKKRDSHITNLYTFQVFLQRL